MVGEYILSKYQNLHPLTVWVAPWGCFREISGDRKNGFDIFVVPWAFMFQSHWERICIDIGVSQHRGTLKWMVKIMENPYFLVDDLGVPLFLETSICCKSGKVIRYPTEVDQIRNTETSMAPESQGTCSSHRIWLQQLGSSWCNRCQASILHLSTFIWQESIEWTWWAWSILNLSLNLSVYRFPIGTFLASTCRLSKASFWTMDFILSFFVGCRGDASMTRSRSIRRCAMTGTAYQVWYCRRSGWIPAVKGARMG